MSSFQGNKKRGGEDKQGNNSHKRGAGASSKEEEIDDALVFEDPFGDEYEPEEADENAIEKQDSNYNDNSDHGSSDGEDGGAGGDMDINEDEGETEEIKQVWRPGVDKLEDGETLDYDPSAYIMYHSLTAEWPCLSFDIMRDNLGDSRQRFPHTMFMCMGSQADRADHNKVTILKMSDLHKTGGTYNTQSTYTHMCLHTSTYSSCFSTLSTTPYIYTNLSLSLLPPYRLR